MPMLDRSAIKSQLLWELDGNLITVHVDNDGVTYRIHDKKAGTPRSISNAHPLVVMDVLWEMQNKGELVPEMSDKELDVHTALGVVPTTGCELRVNNIGSTFAIRPEKNGQPVGEFISLHATKFNGHRV